MKTKYLDIISIVISAFALVLSCNALRNTTNYSVKAKQADAVMELVQYLGKTPVSITLGERDEMSSFYSYENYTLLELTNVDFYNQLDSSKIYFDSSDLLPIDLCEFSNNPYMPKSIAEVLKKYSSYKIAWFLDSIENCNNIVVLRNYDYQHVLAMKRDSLLRISRNIPVQQKTVSLYYEMRFASAYRNWAVFKKTNKLLLDAINRWLNKHNIDEVNVPTDHYDYEM